MLSKSMRNVLVVVLMVGFAAMALGCSGIAEAGGGLVPVQTAQTGEEIPYTINVTGLGNASAQPDVVYFNLGVESVETDANKAIEENTTRMNAVLEALTALEIKAEDVQTTNYNMWVEDVYDRDGQYTGEVRYHVINQVNVKLDDISLTGKVLEEALKAGVNNVGGIEFSVDDATALEQEARQNALTDARAKAEELASGLGVRVGKVHLVTEFTNNATPISVRAAYDGAGGGGGEVPIASGSYDVTVQVQVAFDIIQ
ncbi:MAG: SIMPL domain-containing protein [Anaerolineae bacterium]|nr:SIMPL domain-containing protein [Anaerolineae bacterium]